MKNNEYYLVRRAWVGKNNTCIDDLMGRIDSRSSLNKKFTKMKELDNGDIVLFYSVDIDKALRIAERDWADLKSHFGDHGERFSKEFLESYPVYDTEDIKLLIKYANRKDKTILYETL